MTLKEGVRIVHLVPAMVRALPLVDNVYVAFGFECVITSGDDGIHEGRPITGDTKDPHYVGKALDFAIKVLPPEMRGPLVRTVTETLGPAYVVLHEAQGTPSEHVHVQAGHVG